MPSERHHFARHQFNKLAAAVTFDSRRQPRPAHTTSVKTLEFLRADIRTHAGDTAGAVLAERSDDIEAQRVIEAIDACVDLHRALKSDRVAHAKIVFERLQRRRIAALSHERILLRVSENVAMTVGAAGRQRMARLARMRIGANAKRRLRHLITWRGQGRSILRALRHIALSSISPYR